MLARKNCLRSKSLVWVESFIWFSFSNIREEAGPPEERFSRQTSGLAQWGSGQDALHNIAKNESEPSILPLIFHRKPLVIDAQ
jgi:hypothetical protein